MPNPMPPQEKEHLSDDELSTNSTPQLATTSAHNRAIQGTIVSVPEDQSDEFLFLRLGKQLRGKWAAMLERHPQGFFGSRSRRPTEPRELESGTLADEPEAGQDNEFSPQSVLSNLSLETVEASLTMKAAKSALYLPYFGLQRSDDGRPVVPFLSDLLQVIFAGNDSFSFF